MSHLENSINSIINTNGDDKKGIKLSLNSENSYEAVESDDDDEESFDYKRESVVPLNEHHEEGKEAGQSEDAQKEETVPYWKLYKYATTIDWCFITTASLCTIVIGGCKTYYWVLYGRAMEDFIIYVNAAENSTDSKEPLQKQFLEDIFSFSMKSVGLGVLTFLCQYIAGVFYSYSSLQQVFKLRQRFFEKTLDQDISWYDMNKTGDFATTFSENLAKIEEGMGDKVGMFLYYQAVVVSSIIWSLVLGWQLTLVCLVSLPISLFVMAVITWASTKLARQEMESYAQAGAIAEEVFSSIRTVVAFEGQEKEMARYDEHLVDAKNNNIRRNLVTGFSNGFLWLAVYACCALSFWYGVKLLIEQRYLPPTEMTYTPGIVVAIFFNCLAAMWHFSVGMPYVQIFGMACEAAAKIFKVLDNKPKINESLRKGSKLKNLRGEICFENVHFHYPSRPDVKVLLKLNLKIEAGETVAFVGSSGCGKSTCIQLIQRFYDPVSGRITIDGNNMKNLNLSWFRSKIGMVGQEPVLFATTISENIRYGELSATQEDIERAAKRAQVHKFIKSLPNGYDSIIGERGTQLSGGQKQRIAIARALIRKPSILLLDEATSALDTTSEAEVQAALDSVSDECTTIIVAHRLSTVKNANRIFVFDKGQVVEKGTYEELIEAEGVFFNLVKSQGFTTNDSDEPIITIDEEPRSAERPSSSRPSSNRIHRLSRKESFYDFDKFEHRNSVSEKEGSSNVIIWKILKMNSPEWIWIFLGCVSSILIGVSLPIYSVLLGDIMGTLSQGNDEKLRRDTKTVCWYFLLLGIVSGASYVIQIYAFGVAGEKLTLRVRSKLFAAILKQEIGWFDRKENGVGALCAKLSNDASAIQGASGMPIGTLLNSLSTIILANTLGIYFQWKLAFVLCTFFPLIFISIFFEKKLTNETGFREKKLEKSASIAVEAIGNIRTVASLGCEKLFLERYIEELTPYIQSSKGKSHFRSIIMGMAKSLIYYAYACGMCYGAKLLVYEDVPYVLIIKVCELIIIGSWALGTTFAFAPNFRNGIEAAGRMFALLQRVPEIRNVPNASKRKWDTGDIEYSNAYFSYPTRQEVPVLRGLDLNAYAGKTVALVGSSGCGKSTIIQLLERFYNPTAGEVCIDDVDIKIMDLQHLRSNFGIVSQEPNLFDRTIAENIAYGNNQRNIPMSEIIEAAKKANIHNFVTSLPLGYDTSLGTKGTQLSGGQKQRIAIARALVRNPRILLFDEATSALDNESEKIVQEALDRAKEGRTCITIAHRLTTIQDADVICVLEKGRVAEMGKHQELIDRRGLYYNFFKLQGKN